MFFSVLSFRLLSSLSKLFWFQNSTAYRTILEDTSVMRQPLPWLANQNEAVMAKSINKIILVGTLGRDAETKFTPSGVAVTRLSLATERSWKDKQSDEWKSETEWHQITLWRKEKLAEYLTKGVKVYVEGSLKTRSYEKEGQKHYSTEVVASEVVLMGGGSGNGGGKRESASEDSESYEGGTAGDDDVPF